MKKICFLTGTRADFGKLKPLIDKTIHNKNFECYIFVTGMHTLKKYGSTYDEVLKMGYKNIFVYMNQTNSSDMDTVLANTVLGLGNFVKEIEPDILIVHGDRLEALAGAIVGSFNNIYVGHIEGGELSGTIDELIRHSITKMSHIHFVCNKDAKKRLIQMGENKESIFIIGSPDIEIMKSKKLPSLEKAKKRYDIKFDEYGILIFHPVTTELNILKQQISNVVSAVKKSDKNHIVIYPNNDMGSDIIFDAYEELKSPKFKLFPSIRFEYFLTLLKNANYILGNSSVGIREAGVYGIPSIDIGSRQKNRSKNKSIYHVEANEQAILNAILKVNKKTKKTNEFGSEKSADKFISILKNKKTWQISYQKQFVDSL